MADKSGQNRITAPTPLLDENGALKEPGYCFTNLYGYDRSAIKASPLCIKEWDFYEISNERYILLVMIADVSYGATSSVILHDMETGEQFSASTTSLLTFGSYGVTDKTGMEKGTISRHGKNYELDIVTADGYKTIEFKGRAQKIGRVGIENKLPNWMNKKAWLETEWVLKSDDGRLNLTMTPVYDNFTCSRVVFVGNWCHQVFGRFNGTVKLDDGTVLEIKDMMAFCELADNLY